MPAANTGAYKKMSQRAMWRGDRSQSEMIANHGMEGVRQNLLRDTPTYKKEAVGLNKNGANYFTKSSSSSGRNSNANTKVKSSANVNSQNQNKGLGASILGSL
jgi:Tfp pilus assembly protein PilX